MRKENLQHSFSKTQHPQANETASTDKNNEKESFYVFWRSSMIASMFGFRLKTKKN